MCVGGGGGGGGGGEEWRGWRFSSYQIYVLVTFDFHCRVFLSLFFFFEGVGSVFFLLFFFFWWVGV